MEVWRVCLSWSRFKSTWITISVCKVEQRAGLFTLLLLSVWVIAGYILKEGRQWLIIVLTQTQSSDKHIIFKCVLFVFI